MTQLDTCCEEYQRAAEISRRRLLGGLAAAGAAGAVTSVFGDTVRPTAFGATPGGNVLVVISLRGGIDGLGMVVPHGDPSYAGVRGRLALPASSLVARDATFGLHPKMAPLSWLWDSGELGAVQAVGLQVPNRSHFEAIETIEDADPTSSVRRGWVNRMVGLDARNSPLEAVHLGSAMAPTMLEGESPTIAARSFKDVRLSGTTNGWAARRQGALRTTWSGDSTPLGVATRSALGAVGQLQPLAGYQPAVAYPSTWPAGDLSAALKDSAALIKADLGAEVVSVDFGSWDMHNNYGTASDGRMQRMVDAFARSVSAFMRDLGAHRKRVTVVTISEFGRRVKPNGNSGFDHGWGNMMLLMGAGAKGGRYHGSWPGLGPGAIADGDLAVTTDYRQVFAEILAKRFPAKSVHQVFPGLVQKPVGVLSDY
jgi:uncharacterized protein (DUF1501 family)